MTIMPWNDRVNMFLTGMPTAAWTPARGPSGIPTTTTGGLLPMTPRQQGLLGMAGALMEAGGPSPTPVSFGQALGRGLQVLGPMEQQARAAQTRELLALTQMRQQQDRLAREQRMRDEWEAKFRPKPGAIGTSAYGPTIEAAAAGPADPFLASMTPEQREALRLAGPEMGREAYLQQAFAQPGTVQDEPMKAFDTVLNAPVLVSEREVLASPGRYTPYEKPTPAPKPTFREAYDTQAKKNVFVTPQDIAAEPDRFVPSPEERAPTKPFRAIERASGDEVFLTPAQYAAEPERYAPAQQQPLVDIDLGGKKESEILASTRANRFDQYIQRAAEARSTITSMQALQAIEVPQGALEPAKNWLKSYAESMGLDFEAFGIDSLANAQGYNAIAGRMLQNVLNAAKGPQTDDDARRAAKILPQLKNVKDANNFIARATIALEEMHVEKAEFYDRILQKEGTLRNADRAWSEYRSRTPLVAKHRLHGQPTFFNEFKRSLYEYAEGRNQPMPDDETVIKLWEKHYVRP